MVSPSSLPLLVRDCRSITFIWLREFFLKERLGGSECLALLLGSSMSTLHTDSHQIPLLRQEIKTFIEALAILDGEPSTVWTHTVTGFREFSVHTAPSCLGLSFTSPEFRRTLLWNTLRLSTVEIWKDDMLCYIETEGEKKGHIKGKQ